MFDQHFKTNEEVGSLYSFEDLLKVNLLQDDLSTFIHNWESVVAGMSHLPDERTLRDILLRQSRRSARMKWDLDLYDRAKEGTSTQSYSFLIQSIRRLLTRERVRRNRDRIAKSHGEKFGAPIKCECARQHPHFYLYSCPGLFSCTLVFIFVFTSQAHPQVLSYIFIVSYAVLGRNLGQYM